jgi:hypothetical protein
MGIVTSQTERVYGFLGGEIRDCEQMVGNSSIIIAPSSRIRLEANVIIDG